MGIVAQFLRILTAMKDEWSNTAETYFKIRDFLSVWNLGESTDARFQ